MSDASGGKRLLIAAGGTGGHIFPALAVWEVIKERHPKCQLSWIGSSHRMESELIPSMGIDFYGLRQTEIRREKTVRNIFYNIRSLIYLKRAIAESKKIMNDLKPSLLISTGGFAAGAAGLASGLAGVPLVLIEPNAYPGLTNRKLGPAAQAIFISYDSAAQFFPENKTFKLGTPTRRKFRETNRADARSKLGLDEDTIVLVAMGGSHGADSININVPFGVLQIVREDEDVNLFVLHQAGKGRIDEARVFREELPDEMYEVVEFIDDVPAYIAAADVVVTRAGASSLAEIATRGVASIIFPYPKSAEDHQLKNAQAWEEAGAAVLLQDGSTNIGDISITLTDLVYDPDLRAQMAEASKKFAVPDSADQIADKLDKYFQ